MCEKELNEHKQIITPGEYSKSKIIIDVCKRSKSLSTLLPPASTAVVKQLYVDVSLCKRVKKSTLLPPRVQQ